MKNKIVLLIFLLCTFVTYSQNYNNVKNITTTEQEKLFFIDYTATKAQQTVSDNSVYILQEGADNASFVKIKAQESGIDVQQYGNDNVVDIDVKAQKVEERVIQNGDRNIFRDYDHMNKPYHGVDVYQEGENQSIYMNGNNGIIKKLQIKQIGNDKTIYINNF
ncbi:MAG: hypothetical protein ACPG45_06225 [Flavobacteriaceae bacterium]